MEPITASQRKQLRSMAHHLEPVCYVGKAGLAESVIRAIDIALDDHELIKVKFVQRKDEKRELSQQIQEETNSHQVGLIGNIAIFYRQQSDPEKRKIELK